MYTTLGRIMSNVSQDATHRTHTHTLLVVRSRATRSLREPSLARALSETHGAVLQGHAATGVYTSTRMLNTHPYSVSHPRPRQQRSLSHTSTAETHPSSIRH